MSTGDKTKLAAKAKRVACSVCLKEVPLSEAVVPEASDYVAHFCGLECFDKWRHQQPNPDQKKPKAKKPG